MDTHNAKSGGPIGLHRYLQTKNEIGYVSLSEATPADYERIGFKSGLEVHQQLLTKRKLFCRCPAGIFQKHSDYNAEIVRHMRPTLSEMGVYDGTALMEFKTRKEIVYRINNKTACTYEIDDTPPFRIDQEALEIALEISLLCKLNVVGEVHITRKQYLDGSIPTGFQRTAIIGIDGEMQIAGKRVGILQLSIEEDSCREISDIGHTRVYKTDRLGMPLIETVTHPQLFTPHELAEACNFIRFVNRSTGKVRTGIGAARQDVNVSCRGGSRVEIKGVAHITWIPVLSHNEAFRQWALLHLRDELLARIPDHSGWKSQWKELDPVELGFTFPAGVPQNIPLKLIGVKLPQFAGALSHFTQPGKCFANEISDRLKVIACIEKPNMVHSEEIDSNAPHFNFAKLRQLLGATNDDALIAFWGLDADIPTALETIEERCIMAFEGIPPETRKSFEDGTTIFERVLPGADRMYPDTDSAPIAVEEEHLEALRKKLPTDLHLRINQLKQWKVPETCHLFLLRNNLVGTVERIAGLGYNPRTVALLIAQQLKHLVSIKQAKIADAEKLFNLMKYLKEQKLEVELTAMLLRNLFSHPDKSPEELLQLIGFTKSTPETITQKVATYATEFASVGRKKQPVAAEKWVMGQLRHQAIGNMPMAELQKAVATALSKQQQLN